MIRLLGIELSRLRARRLMVILFGAAILNVVVAGAITFARSQPDFEPSSAVGAERRREVLVERCIEIYDRAEDQFRPPPEIARDLCEQRAETGFSFEGFEQDKRFHLTQLRDVFQALGGIFLLVGWVIGASFMGGEWKAGTITTWLTWEPRRERLLVAKAAAAVIGTIGFTIFAEIIVTGALLPSALWRGTTEGTDAVWLRGTIGLGLRAALAAGATAALGTAIATITRSTAGAVGLGFAYTLVVEGILGSVFPRMQPLMFSRNVDVFVANPFQIVGRTQVEAGIVVALYAVALVAIATTSFRARDVT